MKKYLLGLGAMLIGAGFIAVILLLATSSYAQWGSGRDDIFTPHINEGAIGSGRDDIFTPDINEGAIGYGTRR